MAAALSPKLPPGTLSNLIVVDVTPSRAASLSDEFVGYFEGMQKIEDAQVSARQDAEAILKEYEQVTWLSLATTLNANPLAQDPMVRAFLLTNLEKPRNEPMKFKVPLGILKNSLGEISGFPHGPGERTWRDGQVVAIKGKKSK